MARNPRRASGPRLGSALALGRFGAWLVGLGLAPLAVLFVLNGAMPSGAGEVPVDGVVGQVLFVLVFLSFPVAACGVLALTLSGVLALASWARRGMRP